MWRRCDQPACTLCIADPYRRCNDCDQSECNVPLGLGDGPDQDNRNYQRHGLNPLYRDTTRTVTKITMIPTTATKVRTIDLWAKIIIIGWVQRQALNATDAREDFTDVGTTVLLNPLSQAHKTEMGREVAVIKLVLESLNTGLKQRDHIHVFRMLDCPKEGAALFARMVVETNLGLETKVQDVSMSNDKDVQEILPDRG